MKYFSAFEYLLIDVANNFGLDKELYETRIQWATENLHELEDMVNFADDRYLYIKSVLAIREVLAGKETGHLVSLDAICSGMQIMSAITGCKKGAEATGLVFQDVRSDAYTEVTDTMRKALPTLKDTLRDDVKNATMTKLYGSVKEPKELFGEDTPELQEFGKSLMKVAPGACELLEDLKDSWDSDALYHSWTLPDGFVSKNRVMEKKSARIEVDELDHTTFTYIYEENVPMERGVSNVANPIHSVDAYLVRSVERRCHYNKDMVMAAHDIMILEELRRFNNKGTARSTSPCKKLNEYIELYELSGMADVVILPYLTDSNVQVLSTTHLNKLLEIVTDMLKYEPFPVLTNHDAFRCHPNNCNELRYTYNQVLGDLADSKICEWLLNQLYGVTGTYEKHQDDLSDLIRESNYAIN
jgi:hypothetical protein